MHKFVYIFSLLIVCVCCSDIEDPVPVVHAKCGEIRGIARTLNVFGKEMQVEKYLGNKFITLSDLIFIIHIES